MSMNTSLLPEIGPDGLPRESPVIAYTEKVIEEEQLQLRKYIEENYSKIRDVERELAHLSMDMKLTAGPKKAALEMLRKKIEASTEKICLARQKEEEAHKVWEAASQAVKDEEALKQKLCDDLNNLVQESSQSQLTRLEELKRRLEALNPHRTSSVIPQDQAIVVPSENGNVNSTSSPTQATKLSENTSARANGNEDGQERPNDGEARGKKKNIIQGRGKGIGLGLGAVPKGRGPLGPGWTGAGFDA